MPKAVIPSRNAQAQRDFRQRMRDRNWGPHQIYILPEHKLVLDAVEAALRHCHIPSSLITLCQEHLAAMSTPWTTHTLFLSLSEHRGAAKWKVESHDLNSADAIGVRLPELGNLQVHLAAAGNQISVASVLFPASAIEDRAAFNDAALRVGPKTSLTSIGIQVIGGEDVYVAYGSLSSRSPTDTVVEEILILAQNALSFAHLFSSHLGASS